METSALHPLSHEIFCSNRSLQPKKRMSCKHDVSVLIRRSTPNKRAGRNLKHWIDFLCKSRRFRDIFIFPGDGSFFFRPSKHLCPEMFESRFFFSPPILTVPNYPWTQMLTWPKQKTAITRRCEDVSEPPRLVEQVIRTSQTPPSSLPRG